MRSKNERVELEMQILKYRQLLMRVADEPFVQAAREKIAELDQGQEPQASGLHAGAGHVRLTKRSFGEVLRTEMKEYRAYLIDRDGHIKHRVDLVCEDEEAAGERAKLLADGHDVELWLGTEKIATFNRLDS